MVPMCLEADEDEISTAILPATLSSDKKTKITVIIYTCVKQLDPCVIQLDLDVGVELYVY